MEKVFQEIKSLISVGESGLEKIGQPMTDLRNPPVLNHRQLPRSRSRLSKCQLLNIGPSAPSTQELTCAGLGQDFARCS